MLRDLRRTADVLRETGSAKNFEDITEQDWPGGDLNTTAENAEASQEIPETCLSDRPRKTPPAKVDETHPDRRDEHVMQAPADATPQRELPTSVAIGSQTADSGIGNNTLCASVRAGVETDTIQ